jgi:hypothetical protein
MTELQKVAELFFSGNIELAKNFYEITEEDDKSNMFLNELFNLTVTDYRERFNVPVSKYNFSFTKSIPNINKEFWSCILRIEGASLSYIDDTNNSYIHVYKVLLSFYTIKGHTVEISFDACIDDRNKMLGSAKNSHTLTHKLRTDLHIVYKNDLALNKFNKLFKNIDV